MDQGIDKAKRGRQLYVISIVLFVVFCALWAVGPRIEHPAPGDLSVTSLISYLAGIFAWSLMCSAYQMRGKLNAESAQPAK